MKKIETYESQDGGVRFYFSHSDEKFTTGVMVIRANYELPKHNRPLAVENLVQISGECVMKLFSDETNYTEHILEVGDSLEIPRGKYHIHANTTSIESITLFKADGDITAVMENIRKDYKLIK